MTIESTLQDQQIDFDPRDFRNALGVFVTGVTVVTTLNTSGEPIGLTANSFSSVSLSPPLVLWSLSLRSPNLSNYLQATHFLVNILSDKQADISERFARSNSNKFEGLDYKKSQQGLPQLNGISAYFECRTEARHYSGDHVIFIGQVINYQYNGSPTLVYSRGQYKILES